MRPLREGRGRSWFRERIRALWEGRRDRGAEDRLRLRRARGPSVDLDELLADPHLEMHVRGG